MTVPQSVINEVSDILEIEYVNAERRGDEASASRLSRAVLLLSGDLAYPRVTSRPIPGGGLSFAIETRQAQKDAVD